MKHLDLNISNINLDCRFDCVSGGIPWDDILLLRFNDQAEKHVSSQYADVAIKINEVKSIPRGNAVLRWR